MIGSLIKQGVVRFLWLLMGRRNLVRFARYLSNESRFDTLNDLDINGEKMVQEVILGMRYEGKPLVIFDVGANVGIWTESLIDQSTRRSGNMIVHLFEPCAETYKSLVQNVSKWATDKTFNCRQLALSSAAGTTDFYSLGANIGVNSLYPIPGAANQTIESVTTETLDRYCEFNQIDSICLLKIDAEGHDMEVMLGGYEMLSAGRIDVIQFEYNHRWIGGRHLLKDAFDFVLPLGYQIGKVTPRGIEFYDRWDQELEQYREANFIACKANRIQAFPRIKWWNDR